MIETKRIAGRVIKLGMIRAGRKRKFYVQERGSTQYFRYLDVAQRAFAAACKQAAAEAR